DEHAQAGAGVAQVEAVEVVGETSFRSPVEGDRLAGAVAGDGGEDAERAAAARQQAAPDFFAEEDATGEVGGEEAVKAFEVGFQLVLRTELGGGEDGGVDAAGAAFAEGGVDLVERRTEGRGAQEVELGD